MKRIVLFCLLFTSAQLFSNVNFNPLTISVITSDIACNGGSDGGIEVTVSGGLAPYTYEFTDVSGVIVGTGNFISDLPAGNYSISVCDANGDVVLQDVTIVEPNVLVVSVENIIASAPNEATGSFDIIATGGFPTYMYSIDGGGTYSTSSMFTGLLSESYSVMVNDLNGCVTNIAITVPETISLTMATSVQNITCFNQCNGRIIVATTGGVGDYVYNLFKDGVSIPNIDNSNVFQSLCEGEYVVSVISGSEEAKSDIIIVLQPKELLVTAEVKEETNDNNDGEIIINATGGLQSYEYNLSTMPADQFVTSNAFTGLNAGDYIITVKDEMGCIGFLEVTLDKIEEDEKRINFFPNPSSEDLILPEKVLGKRFSVANMVGKEILTGEISSIKFVIKNLNSGIYFLNVSGYKPIKFIKN